MLFSSYIIHVLVSTRTFDQYCHSTMSIPYSGTFKRSAGLVSAIGKQLKIVNLKPVKKIQVQFDPFHENAKSVRDFLYYVSAPKIVNTNLSCLVKTNVVCDRSEPYIKVDLADSKSIKLLSANLSVLELLQIFNKHVSSLVKPEDTAPVQLPKSTKQGKRR